jgi:hypothetical protein
MNGSRTARRSRTGVRYFDEFRTHFWEKPEDAFDRIRNMSISNRRRSRRGSSPAPSIEEVERALSQRSSSWRSSRSNQRGRTRSESPSRNEDGNTGNPAGGGGNTTTSSVQPPSYEANQQSSNSADDEVTLGPDNNVGQ